MSELLSPMQLQAGAYLFQNQGLQVNANLTSAIGSYRSQDFLGNLYVTLSVGGANANVGNSILSNTTIAKLQTFASYSNVCPALGDTIPADFITNTGTYPYTPPITTTFPQLLPTGISNTYVGMTMIVNNTANTYLGNGDYSKFSQLFSASQGYINSTNLFVNSEVNSRDYLGDTFTNNDDLSTGQLTTVNLATQAFADDIANTGDLLDLSNLSNLGTPLVLVQQVIKKAGIVAPLILEFYNVGIDDSIILSLGDPDLSITDSVQKLMYQAMINITGDSLDQILQILEITTPGINNMAELLDPSKIFPNSFQSLTTPTCNGPRGIYVKQENTANETPTTLEEEADGRRIEPSLPCEISTPTVKNTTAIGTVNSNLETELPTNAPGISYNRLSKITSSDLALANKALSTSLGQITNIDQLTPAQLSAAYAGIETTKGLPEIETQLQPMNQSAHDYYVNNFAIGNGVNGTLLLTDIIGTLVGTNQTTSLTNCVTVLNSLNLSALSSIYDVMGNAVTGIYGDPISGPLTGLPAPYDASEPYANADVLVSNTLIPSAQDEIGNIIASTSSTNIDILNNSYTDIGNQLQQEAELQSDASVSLVFLQANSKQNIQTLVLALPSYGTETKVGGTAEFLELITNSSSVSGQSIVACLREGRTAESITVAGVITSNKVKSNSTTPSPQAELSSSVYTEYEAKNLVIT